MNHRWHKPAPARLGSCAACGLHVAAGDDAVAVDGKLCHARCADRPRGN